MFKGWDVGGVKGWDVGGGGLKGWALLLASCLNTIFHLVNATGRLIASFHIIYRLSNTINNMTVISNLNKTFCLSFKKNPTYILYIIIAT